MSDKTYTVYVIAAEDGAALDAIGNLPGFLAMETIEEEQTEASALALVMALDDFDDEAVFPREGGDVIEWRGNTYIRRYED